MKTAIHALSWEVLRKNRIVFPALAILFLAGLALANAVVHAAPDAWWLRSARGFTAAAFLASLLLGFAPFMLMESPQGSRMNSMITRWFVLPVRTVYLVGLPLAAACGSVGLLIAFWVPVLDRIAPGLDGRYLALVLMVFLAVIQALAWSVPRKPSQYWACIAILSPVFLFLALVPQDNPDSVRFRQAMMVPLAVAIGVLGSYGWYAAHRNRHGDWQGEVPLDRLWQWIRQGRASTRRFRAPGTALFASDTLPALRLLSFSWLTLACLVVGYLVCLSLARHRPQMAFSPMVVVYAGVNLMPVLAVVWLAAWGIFVGCEPSAGFRTRLSSFRATLPVSCGALAAQRLATVVLGWAILFLPLLALTHWYDPDFSGMPHPDAVTNARFALARVMVIGASVVIGALPLFLWGRFDGFPNMLLAALCSWAWIWVWAGAVQADEIPHWQLPFLLSVFAAKILGALGALALAWRRGQIAWRFAAGLIVGWATLTSAIIWLLPTWQKGGPGQAVALAILVPLARPALCPLALAANRHR